MAIVETDPLYTEADLLNLGPDFHGELVRGKLKPMAPASWGHGDVAATIGMILSTFVRQHALGRVFAAETGFTLKTNPDTIRAPDVAFVAQANIPTTGDRTGYFQGPPDLAVEVLSPSNTNADTLEKVSDYLHAGTKIVWIVNPVRKTVTLYNNTDTDALTLTSTDQLTGDPVLPGFQITVNTFFE